MFSDPLISKFDFFFSFFVVFCRVLVAGLRRRCVKKETEEVLLEGMPKEYYDDVCVMLCMHLSLPHHMCFSLSSIGYCMVLNCRCSRGCCCVAIIAIVKSCGKLRLQLLSQCSCRDRHNSNTAITFTVAACHLNLLNEECLLLFQGPLSDFYFIFYKFFLRGVSLSKYLLLFPWYFVNVKSSPFTCSCIFHKNSKLCWILMTVLLAL